MRVPNRYQEKTRTVVNQLRFSTERIYEVGFSIHQLPERHLNIANIRHFTPYMIALVLNETLFNQSKTHNTRDTILLMVYRIWEKFPLHPSR